ncbi:MAG: hypothetical protein ABL933_15430, partial [Methyloglobulus sp.]
QMVNDVINHFSARAKMPKGHKRRTLFLTGHCPIWARGYFCVTSGELTEEMIKNYLEHHFKPKGDDNFRTEP